MTRQASCIALQNIAAGSDTLDQAVGDADAQQLGRADARKPSLEMMAHTMTNFGVFNH
jgi:hypothetical protein